MNDEVIKLLKKSDGIFTGHFIYTSGKHASRYLNKMSIFLHPIYASDMGKLFADKYKDTEIDIVVAPAMGGIILGQWTAYHLSKFKNKDILSTYTEKDKGSFSTAAESNHIFTKGNEKYVTGKNVLVVEDIVTTGISIKKVVKAVKNAGGKIVEVCAMANINPDPASISDELVGAKFASLAELPVVLYDDGNCELCDKNVPINTNLGHGKKYLEEKAKKV
ncbi:MAG TPA: phosphoribosyltransferase family protein [Candidatus Saccharimonadales bacterium]|nr:phosphoribosyltransferase family protein [Candidatus Saccharimonadales bacterium]